VNALKNSQVGEAQPKASLSGSNRWNAKNDLGQKYTLQGGGLQKKGG